MFKKTKVVMYHTEATLFDREGTTICTKFQNYYSFHFAVEDSVRSFEELVLTHSNAHNCVVEIAKKDGPAVAHLRFFKH